MNFSVQHLKRIRAAAVEETAIAFGGTSLNYINAVLRNAEKPKNAKEIKEYFKRMYDMGIKAAEDKLKSVPRSR